MREGKAKVLSSEEFARLMRVVAVEMYPLRNSAVMMLSFGLGLRVGEIASLRIIDVMADDGTIREHFQIKKRNSKTRQNREVFLSNAKVRKSLMVYLDHRRDGDGVAFNMNAPLFKSQKGLPFTGNSLQQVMKRLFRKAGLPEQVSSHSGRRGFATKLISSGVDIKSVSVLMGHSNISQTASYAETNPVMLQQVAAQVL